MPKRSSKRSRDPGRPVRYIVDRAIGNRISGARGRDGKNPAAVALGRLGGLKGGKARARALGAAERAAIARKAAKARWSKHRRK